MTRPDQQPPSASAALAVFRLDASLSIGSGHAVRCATLAQAIEQQGGTAVFICQALPGDARAWLAAQGFRVITLPAASNGALTAQEDAAHSAAILRDLGEADWLVVDHYALDAGWESALRPYARRTLVIDDLADRPHDCDLLLDQNLRPAIAAEYVPLLANPAQTRLLIGPQHALLRPEFAALRRQARERSGAVRRVLVSFGGSDAANHTAQAIAALARRQQATGITKVDVVIGSANPHRQALGELIAARLPIAELHVQTPQIAWLMAEADLAIGAGGTTLWERAALGLPSIAFGVAANQRHGLEELIAGGYTVGTPELHDASQIDAWIGCALDNPALLRGLAARSFGLTDGAGAARVMRAMFSPPLNLRAADMRDCAAVFAWRNAPEVRRVSGDCRPLDPESHRAWFSAVISDPARRLLIAEAAGSPVGVVRFDLSPPDAVISVYRVPQSGEGSGLIAAACAWLRANHPEIRTLKAEIVAGNAISLAAFTKAGFRPLSQTLTLHMDAP